MSRYELVSTESRLADVVARLSREPRVAVDLESNGFFRHHERICLVQLAATDTAFLIDPLAIDDPRPLGRLLADRSVEKLFHAPDYDLRSLDRDWGFRVNNLFDTGIAAALLGSTRLGLQSVLMEYAGVELVKRRKLQRSDWTIRPLSSAALDYAAEDVLHLSRAREALSARLMEMSRLEWAEEEFARMETVRHVPSDREFAFLSTKGSRDLDGRGLAVLRSLSHFREQEAVRLDRPLFKVIPDSALLQLSSDPAASLSKVKGLGRYAYPPTNNGLKAAIEKGIGSPPVTRPRQARSDGKLSAPERKKIGARLQILKGWRAKLGSELELDAALLWPAASLKRLAQNPGGIQAELQSPEVRDWQKREFAPALESILPTLS